VVAAPHNSKALVLMPQQRSRAKVILYDGPRRERALPVDAESLLWSADGTKIYFYGGSTVQADGWNILATYDLQSGAVHRTMLVEPTELIRVCPATGYVYTVTPAFPGSHASTVEYTSEIIFRRRVRQWVGATFSARCTYVASEYSFHGPLPWSIYRVNDGTRLFTYAGLDDGKDAYYPIGWNPKVESLLLRGFVAANGQNVLEVFDVSNGHVRLTLKDTDPGGTTWSHDGSSLVVANGESLKHYPIRTPR
jgi:hypothetical protein